ncbi:hypothetical protein ACFRI7_15845 [Streptomyces sp. NPDC056716]|uniref:hypothetical protein n=1 Tax=unclassified Streptomyces TaxID=2593676 RepID=UPI0036C6394A
MAVDPTDPETFVDEDAQNGVEYDVEAPDADTAEQHATLAQDRDDPLTGATTDEADEGDLAEQARVVSLDEDDYR